MDIPCGFEPPLISNEVCDAHALLDMARGRSHPVGRAGHGSTVRSPLPGLPPGLEARRQQLHRLQLYILGSVRDGNDGARRDVLG
jgi:hypothetical protein